jgi:hypothetical protein
MIRLHKYAILFWRLCKTDMLIFRQFIIEDTMNIIIWATSLICIWAYVFPALGMTEKFGALAAFSLVAGESYWRIWTASFNLISDLEGRKTISYSFTLPLPSWLVLAKEIVIHAFKSILYCFVMIPLIGILLWNRLNWSIFSLSKFIIIFVAISFFTGSFFLLLASFCQKTQSVRKIGIRILFPLWFFGASEFPWATIHASHYSKLSYILFANPVLYAMEGIHSAALGKEGFLSFWFCAIMLYLVSFIFSLIGIMRFKKILDIV